MSPFRQGVSAVCLLLSVVLGHAPAVEVELTVREVAKVARRPGIVTSGVPFARGAVRDVSRLSVSIGGKTVPAQFIKTVPWPDGSVRWALMDCQLDLPAGGQVQLTIRNDGRNVAPDSPVRIQDSPQAVRVSTGPLSFTVSKTAPGLFASLRVEEKELLAPGGGLVVYTTDGKAVRAGVPKSVTVEQAGPMRAIVCAKGRFEGLHDGLLGYTVRITAYAGRRFLKVHVWLENDGALGYFYRVEKPTSRPEWFRFDGMAVELALALGDAVRATCEGVTGTGSFRVAQHCPTHQWGGFRYVITSGKKELAKGGRTDGVVALAGPAGKLTVAVRRFWQNYDKAIELNGPALRLWLWPTDGQWPRPYPRNIGSFTRKDIEKVYNKDGYSLPGGVHKGHEFILDFSGAEPALSAARLSRPLMARADADYYASTEALPGWFGPPAATTGDAECDAKLAAWNRMARNAIAPAGTSSIYHARRGGYPHGYWYGWMDFGDITIGQGRGYGPCNLHYDWTWVMLLNYLRLGERGFLELGSEMARHRIDIDQGWSDREMLAYRALQRSDSALSILHCPLFGYGMPSPAKNWIAGVALYYMLTGEPKARQCCLRDGEGIRNAWADRDAKAKARGRSYVSGLGQAGRSIEALCVLYDLTTQKAYLDQALALFRKHLIARSRRYGPHMFDGRRQVWGQAYHGEGMQYCRIIPALCALHHRTGNPSLMKLLKAGCDKPFPESFYDAPLHLSDLLAYVGYKARNSDYLERAVESFIEGFPESKSPPVFRPEDSLWSQRAAVMLQTGQILQYVHWRMKREASPPARH